jgi:hypothetical protein
MKRLEHHAEELEVAVAVRAWLGLPAGFRSLRVAAAHRRQPLRIDDDGFGPDGLDVH